MQRTYKTKTEQKNTFEEPLNPSINSNEITNNNALDISEEKKFDIIILDSPCSGVGTLRRNPEILFKQIPPDLDFLTKVQK